MMEGDSCPCQSAVDSAYRLVTLLTAPPWAIVVKPENILGSKDQWMSRQHEGAGNSRGPAAITSTSTLKNSARSALHGLR
jgi:hypothetical protein